MNKPTCLILVVLTVMLLHAAAPIACAIDEEHYRRGQVAVERAIEWLRTQQDEQTGGWSINPQGPQLPAITGLVVNGMVMQPDIDHTDPDVARAIAFLLSHRQPDGGIYDRILANYNTAISVSALARIATPEAASAVRDGIDFLRTIQWSEEAADHPETGRVSRDHPFYGGVGYGGSSRPDMSNMTMYLQAFHDAGVDCNDPAIQRALVFLQRTQMLDSVNDMDYADGSQQGGFIYATSPDGNNIGVGESKAGMIEETLTTGERVSRLRAYGSMTYAGFKSMIFADLDRDDERVQAAYGWLKKNYTVEENPGIGFDGYYYYLVTMSRAMEAWGLPTLETESHERVLIHDAWPAPTDTSTAISVQRFTTESGREVELRDSIGTVQLRRARDLANGLDDVGTDFAQPSSTIDGQHTVRLVSAEIDFGDPSKPLELTVAITETRSWANDLIARLVELQNEDGSFRSLDDRWMEGNQVLITAYAVLALQHALR